MQTELEELRNELDDINTRLILLLAERFKVTQKVGEYKRDNNLPAYDPTREAAIADRVEQIAKDSGLDPETAKRIMQFITAEVVMKHQALQDKASE